MSRQRLLLVCIAFLALTSSVAATANKIYSCDFETSSCGEDWTVEGHHTWEVRNKTGYLGTKITEGDLDSEVSQAWTLSPMPATDTYFVRWDFRADVGNADCYFGSPLSFNSTTRHPPYKSFFGGHGIHVSEDRHFEGLVKVFDYDVAMNGQTFPYRLVPGDWQPMEMYCEMVDHRYRAHCRFYIAGSHYYTDTYGARPLEFDISKFPIGVFANSDSRIAGEYGCYIDNIEVWDGVPPPEPIVVVKAAIWGHKIILTHEGILHRSATPSELYQVDWYIANNISNINPDNDTVVSTAQWFMEDSYERHEPFIGTIQAEFWEEDSASPCDDYMNHYVVLSNPGGHLPPIRVVDIGDIALSGKCATPDPDPEDPWEPRAIPFLTILAGFAFTMVVILLIVLAEGACGPKYEPVMTHEDM